MISKKTISQLISYATKAPSGHNTQAWRFVIEDNDLCIYPDFERALPFADGDNHELYISLGCALENILLAAPTFHVSPAYSIQEADSLYYIRIHLKSELVEEESVLFEYITSRQVDRGAYENKEIPADIKKLLNDNFSNDYVDIHLFSKNEINDLQPHINAAIDYQYSNNEFKNELIRWMRFNRKSAMKTADGLWSASLGIPSAGSHLGPLFIKGLVTAKSEKKRWNKLIKNSEGFAMFVADKNDPIHWIETGREFQRFGLTLTKYNISHSHMNMPCEVDHIREKMAKDLSLNQKYPMLIIRFGYGQTKPYSFRRSIYEVIDN